MNSDLQTSKEQLRMYLEEQSELPLETLNYIIGEVNYVDEERSSNRAEKAFQA